MILKVRKGLQAGRTGTNSRMSQACTVEQPQEELSREILAMVDFVAANTVAQPIPHVPEITLRLGVEAVPLWDKIEAEFGRRQTAPPYWAFAWAGGQALARYILDHPETVSGRRVLDFASGSGLSAIAAAKAGAAQVIASDIDYFAVVAIALNAEANGVALETVATDLLAEESGFDPASVDIVLAGDVFYEPGIAARSLAFLQRCQAAGAVVLLGDPGRKHLPKDRLIARCQYEVPVSRDVQYSAAANGEARQDIRLASVFELAAA
jgi:predicted nicotinamide N-methyase